MVDVPDDGRAILLPVLAMLVLTAMVWTYMYVKRISYMRQARIRPDALRSPAGKAAALPDEVSFPAHNLINLFELPVAFYVVCIILYVVGGVGQAEIVAAWIYVVLRFMHSIVQCTFNRVMLRFVLYALSSLVLWWLLIAAVIATVIAVPPGT